MSIKVFEGGQELTQNNYLLGKFEINDLPKLPAGSINLDVTFAVDISNILVVTAVDIDNDRRQQIVVANSDRATAADLQRMIDNVGLGAANHEKKIQIDQASGKLIAYHMWAKEAVVRLEQAGAQVTQEHSDALVECQQALENALNWMSQVTEFAELGEYMYQLDTLKNVCRPVIGEQTENLAENIDQN